MGKKEIKTSIEIQAPPEIVWKVLTNFQEYKNWNPFLKSIEGDVAVGNKIKINAGGTTFRPTVLVFDENRELRWIGRLLFKGVFDGEHKFIILDNGDSTTTFKHEEDFNGFIVPLLAGKLDVEVQQAFEAMNQKLKEVAEGINVF